jgi:hypothetical protein
LDRVIVNPLVPVGPAIVTRLSTRSAEGPKVPSPTLERVSVLGAFENSALLKSINPGEATAMMASRSEPDPLSFRFITVIWAGDEKSLAGRPNSASANTASAAEQSKKNFRRVLMKLNLAHLLLIVEHR